MSIRPHELATASNRLASATPLQEFRQYAHGVINPERVAEGQRPLTEEEILTVFQLSLDLQYQPLAMPVI